MTDLDVQLHECCHTKDGVENLLDTVATNFIRREEGDRRAENPFRDDTPDEGITEDGYFLRHSVEHCGDRINVHIRKTNVIPGHIWSSVNIECERVMYFAITEASLNPRTIYTGASNGVFQNNAHLNELKKILETQKVKIDDDIKNAECTKGYEMIQIPNDAEEDSDLDSESESDEQENPAVRLRRRIENENPRALQKMQKLLNKGHPVL